MYTHRSGPPSSKDQVLPLLHRFIVQLNSIHCTAELNLLLCEQDGYVVDNDIVIIALVLDCFADLVGLTAGTKLVGTDYCLVVLRF